MARLHCPNSILIYNDYNVLNGNDTDAVIALATAVKNAGYLDGIGCQSHGLENVSAATVQSNLDKVYTALGVPIYISEFDLGIADDNQQKAKMQELFPVFYQHPHVAGITLWGYVESWLGGQGVLMKSDGTPRPALTWLKDTYLNNLTLGY
jgi:endo-1,4-beta-xylanase